jgi:hypothetical protein
VQSKEGIATMTTDITLHLPEQLVQQAQDAGILTDANVESFLKSELVRYQRRKALIANMEHLQHHELPTDNEIEAEIHAFRREQVARRSTRL